MHAFLNDNHAFLNDHKVRPAGRALWSGAAQDASLLRRGGCDVFDACDDALSGTAIVYRSEGPHQTQRLCAIEKVEHDMAVFTFFGATDRSAKKEQHRYLEDCRNLVQPAGSDAGGSRFVFLHLRECHAERKPQ